jgi:hypothetical protein
VLTHSAIAAQRLRKYVVFLRNFFRHGAQIAVGEVRGIADDNFGPVEPVLATVCSVVYFEPSNRIGVAEVDLPPV